MKVKQKGYTIIELAIAVSVVVLLTLTVTQGVYEYWREAKITASIEQARSVLQVCDIARRKVIATEVESTGAYKHDFLTLDTWSKTPQLQKDLGEDYHLPVKNPLGSDILVKFDAARCYVAVDLPFLAVDYGGYVTETIGGKTRVIITTRPLAGTSSGWVMHQKRVLHQEQSR